MVGPPGGSRIGDDGERETVMEARIVNRNLPEFQGKMVASGHL